MNLDFLFLLTKKTEKSMFQAAFFLTYDILFAVVLFKIISF